jgi:nitrate/nitrite transport system permease protein
MASLADTPPPRVVPLRDRLLAFIGRADVWFRVLGLSFLTPLLRLIAGDTPAVQFRALWRLLVVPLIAIAVFLMLWAQGAPRVVTSLGAVPGPAEVWQQAGVLWQDHLDKREKAQAFLDRQAARNAELVAAGRGDQVRWRQPTGAPSFVDQIGVSLKTVFAGFLLGALIAVPLGVLAGLSPVGQAAINPLVQIFKPVSPLAWLPLVTMVVSAVYATEAGWAPKSFVTSAITVTLCSLWPTLINTSHGVASVDRDLLNVARVLRLGVGTRLMRVILPSAMPLIFTGLRLSLGVGWMVLIAAEMLAQNPGLGKFVWDEFQNGSSDSLARIMVAVFTIGIIGFALDRLMAALQSALSTSTER